MYVHMPIFQHFQSVEVFFQTFPHRSRMHRGGAAGAANNPYLFKKTISSNMLTDAPLPGSQGVGVTSAPATRWDRGYTKD